MCNLTQVLLAVKTASEKISSSFPYNVVFVKREFSDDAVEKVGCSTPRHGRFIPEEGDGGSQWKSEYIVSRADLGRYNNAEMSCQCRESKCDSSVIHTIA
jgi:hypothetical protein